MEIAKLLVSIGSDISDLESGISKAQRKLQDAGRSMQRVGSQMTMAITAPMAAAGTAALRSAAKFESLQQSMNTLNGSVEEGTRNFERLKEFSATTPFQLEDLAEAQNMLQGFGLAADEAFDSMSMIGDIAAVASGDIKGIGIAFGQASAEGRLMTRDIRQLINQGVPAIKLLSETMDVAKSEVLELASEGEISFEILQQAFRDATSEGGMFADGMAKQARTLGGIWSTFKDNVSIALADVGQAMADAFDIKGVADSLIATIQSMLASFNSLSDETRRMAFYVAGLLGAGGPILVALGTLTAALGAISWPVVLGVAAIGGAITAITTNWDTLVDYFTRGDGAQLWQSIESMSRGMWSGLKALFKAGSRIIRLNWVSWGKQLTKIAAASFSAVVRVAGSLFGSLAAIINAFTGDWERAWINIVESAASIMEVLQPATGAVLRSQATMMRAELESQKAMVEDYAKDINDALDGIQESVKRTGTSGTPDTDVTTGGGQGGGQESSRMGFVESWRMDEGMQKLDRFTNKIKSVKGTTESAFNGMRAATSKYATVAEAAGIKSLTFLERFQQGMAKAGEQASLMSDAVTMAFQSMADKSITSLGELLSVTLNTARKIISAEIAKGVAAAVRGALTNVPFPANIAAAAGAGAAAAGLFNSIVPKLAQGGLAFGPTMAVVGDNRNARSNPEVIAPLDKLQGMIASSGGGATRVEGIIRGSDIHLANERGKNKFR